MIFHAVDAFGRCLLMMPGGGRCVLCIYSVMMRMMPGGVRRYIPEI
jgi:hypothetical protein